eukprot:scaffold38221_cov17-Tisochrysis_lutea.AAC.1
MPYARNEKYLAQPKAQHPGLLGPSPCPVGKRRKWIRSILRAVQCSRPQFKWEMQCSKAPSALCRKTTRSCLERGGQPPAPGRDK